MGYDHPADVDSSCPLDPAFCRSEPPASPEPVAANLQPDSLDDDPTALGPQASGATGQGVVPPAGVGMAGQGAMPPQLAEGFPAVGGYLPVSAPPADYAQTPSYLQPSGPPQVPGYQPPSGYPQVPGYPQSPGAPLGTGPQSVGLQAPMDPSGFERYDVDETVFTGRRTGVAPLPPAEAPDPDATMLGVHFYEAEGLTQQVLSRLASPSDPAQAVSAPQTGPRGGGEEQSEDPEAIVFGMPSHDEFARYSDGLGAQVPYGEVAPEETDGQQG